ncbi:META domain-containing protein [Providencia vermicola]|uniref:META domain-containing protein n=3 Tax=Providencia TaxID=586 RepID=A0AAI9HYY6_PROST|nr:MULTISPECIES: META domain-containing protein [Providencia]ELR5045648.1 META domain-containing protein [Providencia rettgeri]ELR5035495.1 META domain-containing protein [Providencia stuartii]ELR5120029.1 META domain-containing protein [Providencia stuartii]ELR5141785.1 META domain-containing protein [Providencia stuartii]ELR5291136.1 META domain-containing protein [Providencia stuartii]
MKRIIPLTLLGLLLAACQTQNVSADNNDNVTEQQLIHHNFVLTEIDGKPIIDKISVPSLSFGEKMFVSATMCNDFHGMGRINKSTLMVKHLSKTELECVDEDLSKWDSLINRMLTDGADISFSDKKLTLTQGRYKLVYTLKDYMN